MEKINRQTLIDFVRFQRKMKQKENTNDDYIIDAFIEIKTINEASDESQTLDQHEGVVKDCVNCDYGEYDPNDDPCYNCQNCDMWKAIAND